MLNTSIEPILSADLDSNGTDYEVYGNAMSKVGSSNFLFVHFHGIDDQTHDAGPLSLLSRERIAQIDDYVQKIVEAFSGKVIITSDHGLSKSYLTKEGIHGKISYEESIVPYAIIKGLKTTK
jgi:predicted AlkP superfamily pyrophosphatase or phosphodiesterase